MIENFDINDKVDTQQDVEQTTWSIINRTACDEFSVEEVCGWKEWD